jgi:uncharacterized repeat protein (TIGR01451 family)
MNQNLTLSVGEIGVRFELSESGPTMEIEAPYERFIGGSSHNLAISVSTGTAQAGAQNPSFDSSIWSLHRSGSVSEFVVHERPGAPPHTLALNAKLGLGKIEFWEQAQGCLRTALSVLQYPLVELIYVSLLSSQELGAILHACAVSTKGRGLAFVGKSGAGKSTTARLWLQRGDATVLCDDRIIVRQMGGVFRAYGTPWHGDIPAVSPASAPLEKILFIRHGAENRLTPLRPAEAVSRLMGCVFTTWWDPAGLAFTLSFLEELARAVPCYDFAFRPEPEALDAALAPALPGDTSMIALSLPLRLRRSGARLLLTLLCISVSLAPASPTVGAQPLSFGYGLTILSSDETGLTLALDTPTYALEQARDDDGVVCDLITVEGAEASAIPNKPALPELGALLGLPPKGDVWLEIVAVEGRDLPGRYNPCPAPQQVVALDLEGAVSARHMVTRPDPAIYGTDAIWPTQPAMLGESGWLRGLRVARVALYPLQVNPVTGRLRHNTRLVVRLAWSAPEVALASAEDSPSADSAFDGVYRGALANWPQASGWLRAPQAAIPAMATAPSDAPRLRLLLRETGLYRLTYAQLAAAGAPVDALDPRTLALSHLGQEAAIQVEGEADGSFDPTDAILFYGQAIDSPHTRQNVYWLSWGEAEGLRMAARDARPDGSAPLATYFIATLNLEQDGAYHSQRPSGPDADHWYFPGYIIGSGAPASGHYPFELPLLSTEQVSSTVQVLYRGFSATIAHRCQTRLNGVLLDDATWPSDTPYGFTVTVPPGTLLAGANAISVTCGLDLVAGQFDIVLVNWFRIGYPHPYLASGDRLAFAAQGAGLQEIRVTGFTTATLALYDVTDPARSVWVSGTVEPDGGGYALRLQTALPSGEERYLALAEGAARGVAGLALAAPSDWRSTSHGADYLIISHADFLEAIQPLAARRAAEGLRVAVVNVREIYDEFAHGLPDPEGIRAFVRYAYEHWQPPAPAYVLLVGDGNYDPKNNLGRGEISYLPPYLAAVDPWMGETAADNRYVCVDGDDILPDLHLGRLPVKTAQQAQDVVAKILAYEAAAPGDWQKRVTFVADDPDGAGDFRALSNDIANNHLPVPYTAERIYYGLAPHETATQTRNAITAAYNAGRLIINYIGHSSIQAWASPIFWDIPRVNALANPIYPLIVPMTCLEGLYIHPSPTGSDYSSLSETAVRVANKGAIASFAPTGLGIATGHSFMHRGLYRALFVDGVTALGPAATLAKLNLYTNTWAFNELIDTYLLMGDPALRLKLLQSDLSLTKTVEPAGDLRVGDAITYTLSYANAGPATAFNVQIADPLPKALASIVVTSSGAAITPRVGSRYVWDVADLTAGAGGVITITATLAPTAAGALSNEATITSTTPDVGMADNVDSALSTVWGFMYLPMVVAP